MKTETTVKDKSALDVSVAAKEGFSILGKSVIKKDTMEKILGSAKCAADMELPNMLYGGVFRSTICHGVIKSFDPSAALAIPGVVTVLTSKDIPGKNRIGIILKDEPIHWRVVIGQLRAEGFVLPLQRAAGFGVVPVQVSRGIGDHGPDFIQIRTDRFGKVLCCPGGDAAGRKIGDQRFAHIHAPFLCFGWYAALQPHGLFR